MSGPTKQMSALDALFWKIDTPETPMHIGGVAVVAGDLLRDEHGRLRLNDIRAHIEARLQHLPRFMQRVESIPLGLGRPVWVDDVEFSIERHVFATVLTGNADEPELQNLCDLAAEIITRPMRRDEALWEFWLVDGLDGGNIGLIEKVHHSLVDGISNMEMAAAIFDIEPQPAPDTPDEFESVKPPSSLRRLAGALVSGTFEPLVATARTTDAVLHAPRELGATLGNVASAAAELIRPSTLAPIMPFNRPIGRGRRLHTVSFHLSELRPIAAFADSTLNDVALALTAGALRSWLLDHGEPCGDVHALIPMSTHTPDGHLQMGNHIGAMIIDLPVSEDDPHRRLHTTVSRMDHLKSVHEGQGVAAVLEALDHLPSPGLGLLTRAATKQSMVNLVITNLGHLRPPVFFLGAEVEHLVPIGPLAPGIGVGFAVLTYQDHLTFAVLADPEACEDSGTIVSALRSEVALFQGLLSTGNNR